MSSAFMQHDKILDYVTSFTRLMLIIRIQAAAGLFEQAYVV
jgi:hypothetical protein